MASPDDPCDRNRMSIERPVPDYTFAVLRLSLPAHGLEVRDESGEPCQPVHRLACPPAKFAFMPLIEHRRALILVQSVCRCGARESWPYSPAKRTQFGRNRHVGLAHSRPWSCGRIVSASGFPAAHTRQRGGLRTGTPDSIRILMRNSRLPQELAEIAACAKRRRRDYMSGGIFNCSGPLI